MRYYAVENPYGVASVNTFFSDDPHAGGTRADKLLCFGTRAERDEWVRNNAHFTESVSAKSKYTRRHIRRYVAMAVCPCCEAFTGAPEPTCAYCNGAGIR